MPTAICRTWNVRNRIDDSSSRVGRLMKRVLILFLVLFLFRLTFGLLHAAWTSVDQRQTYLIGLKSYTTRTWPYFGPDVYGSESDFQSQTPGALEGLLIAVPLHLLPIPEAPFIAIALMSTAAVMVLAWYTCKRLPRLPFPWLCWWIAAAPWSLHLATHVINPAFIFLPSVLFFLGFMEAVPALSLRVIPLPVANALMGVSLFAVLQLHFSYVYFLPFAGAALLIQMYATKRLSCLAYFALGALPALAFVIPTWIHYGVAQSNVGSGFVVPFNANNAKEFLTILARALSMVCFELPRFLGGDTAARLAFLQRHPLLIVPAVTLGLVGLIQPVVLLYCWFLKSPTGPGWQPLRWLVVAAVVVAEVSFWFTIKRPLSHIFFVFFPLLMIYSCYCWVRFAPSRSWRVLAKTFVVASVLFQIGYAIAMAPGSSLYQERSLVSKAIRERNYQLLGERRPKSLY